MPDLLLELFSEEIPARMQGRAADDLKRLVTNGLVEAGLTYASAGAFATPRRLVLTIEGLTDASPTTTEERKGPQLEAPEKAVEGFLRSFGLDLAEVDVYTLESSQKGKPSELRTLGEVLDYLKSLDYDGEVSVEREIVVNGRTYRADLVIGETPFEILVVKGKIFIVAILEKPGRPASDIIADVVPGVIRAFPWPKSMRWGTGSLRWVRPLHSILCVLSDESGTEIVPFDVDGFTSGNTTEGHRFMAPGRFAVSSFADYEAKLSAAKVVLSAEARAETIWHDATNMAFAAGMEVVEDKALLAEVAGLVEWPVVLMGEIGEDFLGLPAEVLQTSMREHQKFFSVRNPATGRIERFITVANRETADHGATIIAGNAKVLSARLADAKFFWDNDLRIARDGMGAWREALKNVTFERRLGTQAERVERIAALAREIAPMVGADPTAAETAARIAKADLNSEMVYEFPELQGVMGKYYALEAGLDPAIAAVAEEHYAPLGPTDAVPTAPLSVAVALADKLDLLTGFWAIDEKPTGSKDPFALRRAALGIIRIVETNTLRLRLDRFFDAQLVRQKGALIDDVQADEVMDLLREIAEHGVFGAAFRAVKEARGKASNGLEAMASQVPDKSDDLLAFFHDRLKVHLKAENIRHDVIDAALSKPPTDDLTLVVARARALQAFLDTPDGENLIQGYKRSANILAQAEDKDGVEYRYGADVKFAETTEERALFAALDAANTAIAPAMADERFADAMAEMARLRAPIDAFFEAVQVNADSDIIRRNRLNLLHDITQTCGAIADLSRIES